VSVSCVLCVFGPRRLSNVGGRLLLAFRFAALGGFSGPRPSVELLRFVRQERRLCFRLGPFGVRTHRLDFAEKRLPHERAGRYTMPGSGRVESFKFGKRQGDGDALRSHVGGAGRRGSTATALVASLRGTLAFRLFGLRWRLCGIVT